MIGWLFWLSVGLLIGSTVSLVVYRLALLRIVQSVEETTEGLRMLRDYERAESRGYLWDTERGSR